MKKLLTIILLSIFYISVNAQLQRNILGAKLGASSPAYVKSIMAQKGNKAEIGETNDTYIFDNVKFAGKIFDMVRFDFFEGKLFSVTFLYAFFSRYSKHGI